jgi:orotidine-5'-phosphate decarboxylase
VDQLVTAANTDRADKLLVALDVESGVEALALADRLSGIAGGMKVGSRLFTIEGPDIVRNLAGRGHRVFLDLKFHDIPNTVATAISAATSLGVWMVNVHAAGGVKMMRAAKEAAVETAQREGRQPPLVIAVTVLTSLDGAALAETGVQRPLLDQVVSLARLAQSAGLDGVVASPLETPVIRRECGPGFAIVTPGIRGGRARTAGRDDQARTMSPSEAIAAGSSYLVVGRPVIAAADARAAAAAIAVEMREGKPAGPDAR